MQTKFFSLFGDHDEGEFVCLAGRHCINLMMVEKNELEETYLKNIKKARLNELILADF